VPYLRLSRVTGTLVLSCQKSPDPIVTLAAHGEFQGGEHGTDMGVSCVAGHRLPNLQDIYMLSGDFLRCRSLCACLLILRLFLLRLRTSHTHSVVRLVPSSIEPHVDRRANHIAIASQLPTF
jgi:hypothetical protein